MMQINRVFLSLVEQTGRELASYIQKVNAEAQEFNRLQESGKLTSSQETLMRHHIYNERNTIWLQMYNWVHDMDKALNTMYDVLMQVRAVEDAFGTPEEANEVQSVITKVQKLKVFVYELKNWFDDRMRVLGEKFNGDVWAYMELDNIGKYLMYLCDDMSHLYGQKVCWLMDTQYSLAAFVNDLTAMYHRVWTDFDIILSKVGLTTPIAEKAYAVTGATPDAIEFAKRWNNYMFISQEYSAYICQSIYIKEDFDKTFAIARPHLVELRVGSAPGHLTRFMSDEGIIIYYDRDTTVVNVLNKIFNNYGGYLIQYRGEEARYNVTDVPPSTIPAVIALATSMDIRFNYIINWLSTSMIFNRQFYQDKGFSTLEEAEKADWEAVWRDINKIKGETQWSSPACSLVVLAPEELLKRDITRIFNVTKQYVREVGPNRALEVDILFYQPFISAIEDFVADLHINFIGKVREFMAKHQLGQ